jgi:probable rRNA maturation factor
MTTAEHGAAIEVAVHDALGEIDTTAFVDDALAILAALDVPADTELSLYLVLDEPMHELNVQWRDIDRTTDVLSFPQDDEPALLGDVVLNLDAIERQAAEHGLGPAEERRFLLIHGVLHLLGHDHHEDGERAVMEAEEQRIWEALGGEGRIR